MCAFKCDICFHKKVCVGSPSVEPITQDCALYSNVENFNSLQQLKAEIRAISDIIELSDVGAITVDFARLKQRLRELSAV